MWGLSPREREGVVVQCGCGDLSEYGCKCSVILAEMWDVEEEEDRRKHIALMWLCQKTGAETAV